MRQFCNCGHSEAWHTGPKWLEPAPYVELTLALSFMPIPGKACDVCDCKGYVRQLVFSQAR